MSLLYPFASLGVINGIVIAFYLFFRNRRTITDLYFAGLILAFCIRIGKSVILHYTGGADPLVLQIGLSACIFIGPFFYLYLKSLEKNVKNASKDDHILLTTLLLTIVVTGLIFPYRSYPAYWNPEIVQGIYAIWALFVLLGLNKAYKLLGNALVRPWKLRGDRQYLAGIVIVVVLITMTYQSALYFARFTYIWGAFIFSFSFYLLGFRALRNKTIAAKPAPKKVDGSEQLMERLNGYMEREQPYKNPSLKLDDLAAKLDVTRHTLSQALNQSKEKGYTNYIQKHRIEEAKKMILSKTHLSLEGIGYEAGFKSKSSFFEAFKKRVNCTPAAYKRQAATK